MRLDTIPTIGEQVDALEMAIKEAIKIFKDWIKNGFPYDGGYAVEELDVDEKKACKMAIQALEQMPEVTSTMQTGQFDYVPIREIKGISCSECKYFKVTQEPICDRDCEHCTWTECPIEPCDDAVSRILKRMWNCRGKHTTSIDKVKMEQIIRDELPSVTVRQTGEWINLEKTKYKGQSLPFWGRYECSACKGHGQDDFNYCPNCGACMKDGRTLDEFIEDSKAESEK